MTPPTSAQEARRGVAVLVPVLGRPWRVEPLLEALTASRPSLPWRALFLCSPGDDEEAAAVRAAGVEPVVVPWPADGGDFARKHNYGFEVTDEEWVFVGADDLFFRPGWLEAALAAHARTGACVVGVNDLASERVRRGLHATHFLVHRDYRECGTADEAGKLLHEGYDHNFVDDEFVATAKARGTFVAATDSIVEHLHPLFGTGQHDATYAKGQRRFDEDRALFQSRQALWQ